MLKGILIIMASLFLGACSGTNESEWPVVLTTTIAPEVTLDIRNDSGLPLTVRATSSIGATVRKNGEAVVNQLMIKELVIEPHSSFTFNWGAIDEAIAIAGTVDLILDGEEFRLGATF